MDATPPIPTAEEPRPRFDLRAWVRNSPWLAIAILLHILIIAILSVTYIATATREVEEPVTALRIASTPLELPPAIEEPPEIIDRNSVPVLPDQEEGPVNPDEHFIPDAAAGRVGEITDEIDPTKDPGIFNPDPEALSNLPSGATGGTPIGVGAVGHYGTGTPSAFVSRRAGGGGKGGGGLGQGGGGGRGGQRAEQAVSGALVWLAKHQSPDGKWDADDYSGQCELEKGRCSGFGSSANDVGLTGLALLCFLGAGETHDSGSFRNTVKEGLKYLISVQDGDGCFGERVGHGFMYSHACAALAMAEAYGMTRAKPFRDPAQKGINFVLRAQNPYAAWRYSYPPDGDNDTSVTGWMVMVLKSAKLGGLTIDDQSMTNALTFIDQMTDAGTGRTGYLERGTLPSRPPNLLERFPADKTESLTAVGLLVRVFGERDAAEDPMIAKGQELLLKNLPTWDDLGSIDFYYWYYGTLAMFQLGGEPWETWNEAIKTAVLDHQHTLEAECQYGSWDPLDPWSDAGGRIYATALNCLSMEVYYRYPRVFGASSKGTETTGAPKPGLLPEKEKP